MAATATKICTICNTDCADRPRVKDEFGRYACKACLEKQEAQAAAKAKGATGAPPKAGEDDELDLRSAAMMEAKSAAMDLPEAQCCPKCNGFMPNDQRLCMRCGFDRKRGAKVMTKVEKVVEPRDARKDGKRREIALHNYAAWGLLVVCVAVGAASFVGSGAAFICLLISIGILSYVGITTKICQAIDGDWGWFVAGLFIGLVDIVWILIGWRVWLKIMLVGPILACIASIASVIMNAE